MPRLLHFSEDPTITLFKPQMAPTSVDPEPLVWALDDDHAPSYWFPRDCPRACCWRGKDSMSDVGGSILGAGGADRLHAIESVWLSRVRACRLYAYEFDPGCFNPKLIEAGYWVARQEVVPISVTPVGDLLDRHVEAGIELRVVPNLWPLIDAIVTSGLEFSIIRKANTQPRAGRQ